MLHMSLSFGSNGKQNSKYTALETQNHSRWWKLLKANYNTHCYKNSYILWFVISQRGTRNCWAWRKYSFETNKWNMFLEAEATFPFCNWSIKMARIIWFGWTSVDIFSSSLFYIFFKLSWVCFISRFTDQSAEVTVLIIYIRYQAVWFWRRAKIWILLVRIETGNWILDIVGSDWLLSWWSLRGWFLLKTKLRIQWLIRWSRWRRRTELVDMLCGGDEFWVLTVGLNGKTVTDDKWRVLTWRDTYGKSSLGDRGLAGFFLFFPCCRYPVNSLLPSLQTQRYILRIEFRSS